MADFVALLAMCVLLPVAGATMLKMWQTRPPRRRHSGLAVGQIPQPLRRRTPMAVRRGWPMFERMIRDPGRHCPDCGQTGVLDFTNVPASVRTYTREDGNYSDHNGPSATTSAATAALHSPSPIGRNPWLTSTPPAGSSPPSSRAPVYLMPLAASQPASACSAKARTSQPLRPRWQPLCDLWLRRGG